MPAVGRRRKIGLQAPAGVREIGGVWYWRPTSKRERDERRARGEPIGCTLGAAGSKAARKRWAEVSGYREEELAAEGTVGELVTTWRDEAIGRKPGGSKRSPATVRSYKYAVPHVLKRFRDARYGKTEHDAAAGRAIGTADIQRFVAENGAMGNIYLAVLTDAFNYGIRCGRTVYNPCDKAVKNDFERRTRQYRAWEEEVLQTLARPREALIIDYEACTGDRINEILAIKRADFTAEGIRVTRKGGKVEIWRWTPRLRTIAAEALKLPGASKFPGSPLFPGRRGKPFTYAGFNAAWQKLKRLANTELAAAGIVDPDTLKRTEGLAIVDLHFHDGRSKVHDDAVDAGRKGHEQIGDTESVATVHYARRETLKTPLK